MVSVPKPVRLTAPVEPDAPEEPEAKRPKSSTGEPDALRRMMLSKDDAQKLQGLPSDQYAEAVVISVDVDRCSNQLSKKALESLEVIQGLYFMIGNYGLQPVYRQEKPDVDDDDDVPNNRQCFLWFNAKPGENGWFITDGISPIEAYHAWAPQRSDAYPIDIYVPPNAKAPCPAVQVQPYIMVQEAHCIELKSVNNGLNAEIAKLKADWLCVNIVCLF